MLEIENLKNSLLNFSNSKVKELTNYISVHEAQLPMKVQEIISVYEDSTKPKVEDAYEAAHKFLKGELDLNAYLYDIVAFALNQPIAELSGATVVSNEGKLSELLERYSNEINSGDFWELTYLGVLQSYFQISNFNNSLEKIRNFLDVNFKKIYQSSNHKPLWMIAVNENQHLLSTEPCLMYADEWLKGEDERVKKIKSDIKIPENSWFWTKLVCSCVEETTKLDDISFKESIPKLLNFIKQHPIYVDDGLLATLKRYNQCSDNVLNKELKDFSVELWKNPRLRNVGGSKWLRIEDSIWQMVLGWVNEANLRLFFQLLKQGGVADKSRLDFWLKYINQVSWTKLVIGSNTHQYFNQNKEMSKIFENEKESFSKLEGENSLDVFIMKIQNYLIVEFSTEGGCYIYKDGENTFDPEAKKLNASTNKGGLKEKRKWTGSPDIIHKPGWQTRAASKLFKLSIIPDTNNLQNSTSRSFTQKVTSHTSVGTKTEQAYKEADDLARAFGIRTENLQYKNENYWVYFDREVGPVAKKLKELGFKFQSGKGWWLK
jgi:hypothetical protein